MRLRRAICTAVGIGALGSAPAAQAAHVGFEVEQSGNGDSAATLVYAAAPGEQNDLSAGWDGVSHWIFRENGAVTLTAGSGCQPVDPHTVDCNAGAGSPNDGGPDFGFTGSEFDM